jgi:alkaline phosphatase D
VVFVSGDTHSFIAGDVRVDDEDRKPAATEFVGGSITTPGLAEGGALEFSQQLRAANGWGAHADFEHHGYGLVETSRAALRCTFRRVATVKARSPSALPDKRFCIERGQPGLGSPR